MAVAVSFIRIVAFRHNKNIYCLGSIMYFIFTVVLIISIFFLYTFILIEVAYLTMYFSG